MQSINSKLPIFYFRSAFFLICFLICLYSYISPASVFAQESSSSATVTIPATSSGIILVPSANPTPTPANPTPSPSPELSTDQSSSSSAITASLSLTNDQNQSSASIRQPLKLLPLSKKQFLISEPIQIEVLNTYDETPHIHVLTEAGREVPFFHKEISSPGGNRSFQINAVPNMSPGKYVIQTVISTGVITSDPFLWGTFFVNSDKSSYQPHENIQLGIGLLDENGQKVCDADMELKLENTTDIIATTSKNTIKRNPECRNHTITEEPDYKTTFTSPDKEGTYTYVFNATINGKPSQQIKKEITVKKNPFEIERTAPARLFPKASYPVKLKIKANQDFSGLISDLVPESFVIKNSSDSASSTVHISTGSAYPDTYSLYTPLTFNLGKPFDGAYVLTQAFGGLLDNEYAYFDYPDFGLIGHDGIDFGLPEGTPVKATDEGIVEHAGDNPYGKTVIITHSWGKTYYGHLSVIYVTDNQKVSKGDVIGVSGNTGYSTGPHLHFGILPTVTNPNNGFFGKINPLPFLGMNQEGNLLKNFPHLFDATSKKISWNVNLKSGDAIELSYIIEAPPVSPETYTLGPVVFEKEIIVKPTSGSSDLSENTSTPSGIILSENSHISPEVVQIPTEVVYRDTGTWTLSADTQIQIDDSVHFRAESHESSSPATVFVNSQVGYIFFRDLSGKCIYSQTLDGGNTWKKQSSLTPSTGCLNVAVWYDRETPGDTRGKFIHIVTTDKDTNRVFYNRLDGENNHLLFTETSLDITSGFPNTLSLSENIPVITRASDGSLFLGLLDNDGPGSSFILRCTSNCQEAGNWKKTEDPGLPTDKTQDRLSLVPLSNSRLLLLHFDNEEKKIMSKELDMQKNKWDENWKEAATEVEQSPSSWSAVKNILEDTVYLTFLHGENIGLNAYHLGQWENLPSVLENENGHILSVKLGMDLNNTLYAVYAKSNVSASSDHVSLFYKTSPDKKTWSDEKGPLNIFEGSLRGVQVTWTNSDRLRVVWIDTESMTMYLEQVTDSQSLEKKMRNGL